MALAVPISRHNKRIAAQKGFFTVHGKGKKSISDYADRIVLINIQESLRDSFKHSLDVLGIKEDDIYPDLSSLSQRILREWSE